METVGLGLGSMILIAIILAYYGVFGVIGTVADRAKKAIEISSDMGIREVEKLADEQINRHDDWYITNKIDKKKVVEAAGSRAYYKALREGKVPPSEKAEA